MQFLFHGKPTAAVEQDPPANLVEKAKADWVVSRRLYNQGVLRSVWGMGSGVIALCEADSREELEAMLAAMPMVEAGLIDIEVHELTPYVGFAPELSTW